MDGMPRPEIANLVVRCSSLFQSRADSVSCAVDKRIEESKHVASGRPFSGRLKKPYVEDRPCEKCSAVLCTRFQWYGGRHLCSTCGTFIRFHFIQNSDSPHLILAALEEMKMHTVKISDTCPNFDECQTAASPAWKESAYFGEKVCQRCCE